MSQAMLSPWCHPVSHHYKLYQVTSTKQAQTATSKSRHTSHLSANFSYDALSGPLRCEGGGPVTSSVAPNLAVWILKTNLTSIKFFCLFFFKKKHLFLNKISNNPLKISVRPWGAYHQLYLIYRCWARGARRENAVIHVPLRVTLLQAKYVASLTTETSVLYIHMCSRSPDWLSRTFYHISLAFCNICLFNSILVAVVLFFISLLSIFRFHLTTIFLSL